MAKENQRYAERLTDQLSKFSKMTPKLTLEAIQIVSTIAREGSFSAAAEILHKVPSTISYSVAKLEEQLGITLFQRNGPRVSLTPAGETLLAEGQWLLQAAGDLEYRLQRVAKGYEAEIRIVHDSILPTSALLPDIQAFQALNCGTRLNFGIETMNGCWDALKNGRADLIIASGEGPLTGGYALTQVGSVEFVFCVAPNHPLAKLPQPLTAADLLAHTAIVVADTARTLPGRTVGLLSGQNRITVSTMRDKIALQKAGLGHGSLPKAQIEGELQRGELVILQTELPRPVEAVWLAWRTDDQGEAVKWWVERLNRPLLPELLTKTAN